MSKMLPSHRVINEGSSASYTAFLCDADGIAIPLVDISAMTLTLKDVATGAVINSRNAHNILNTNNVTYVYYDGEITSATSADPIVCQSASHALEIGDRIHIHGGRGLFCERIRNTPPFGNNPTWIVDRIDANHFALRGAVWRGTYDTSSVPELAQWTHSKLTWTIQAADSDVIATTLKVDELEEHIATFVVTWTGGVLTHHFRHFVRKVTL